MKLASEQPNHWAGWALLVNSSSALVLRLSSYDLRIVRESYPTVICRNFLHGLKQLKHNAW